MRRLTALLWAPLRQQRRSPADQTAGAFLFICGSHTAKSQMIRPRIRVSLSSPAWHVTSAILIRAKKRTAFLDSFLCVRLRWVEAVRWSLWITNKLLRCCQRLVVIRASPDPQRPLRIHHPESIPFLPEPAREHLSSRSLEADLRKHQSLRRCLVQQGARGGPRGSNRYRPRNVRPRRHFLLRW